MNVNLQMEGLLQLLAKLCDERDIQAQLQIPRMTVVLSLSEVIFSGNSYRKSKRRCYRWSCHCVRWALGKQPKVTEGWARWSHSWTPWPCCWWCCGGRACCLAIPRTVSTFGTGLICGVNILVNWVVRMSGVGVWGVWGVSGVSCIILLNSAGFLAVARSSVRSSFYML